MMKIRHLTRKILSDGWTKLALVTFSMKRRDGHWQDNLKREVYERGAAAAILPYDETRGTVLLVRQLRIPTLLAGDEGTLLEACAGVIDHGETAHDAIQREAEEELGYRLFDIEQIAVAYASPGYSTEKLSLFLARYTQASHQSSGGGLSSEGEDIEIVEMPFSQLLQEAKRGEIVDLKTLYLIEALRLRLS